jgi:hypothetical protein
MEYIGLSTQSFLVVGNIPQRILDQVGTYSDLLLLKPPMPNQISIHGELWDFPRYYPNYLQPHTYCGINFAARPLPQILQPLYEWANGILPRGMTRFNHVIMRFHDRDDDYIPRSNNKDDNKPWNESLSLWTTFGDERRFHIRNKMTQKVVKEITLQHGSFLMMGGSFLNEFTYEIPRDDKYHSYTSLDLDSIEYNVERGDSKWINVVFKTT